MESNIGITWHWGRTDKFNKQYNYLPNRNDVSGGHFYSDNECNAHRVIIYWNKQMIRMNKDVIYRLVQP